MTTTLRLRGLASLRYGAPIFLILLLTLAFFYPLAFTDHILARGDTYAYHYPYWAARNAAILTGRLPLWSPDLFMGVPLLANSQIGTFYPPNWLVAPLSPPEGLRLSVLLHVAWTALGTYALARRTLTVSRPAALAAAAIFAFGGYFGAHIEQINQLQGLAWLPWLLLIFAWTITAYPTTPTPTHRQTGNGTAQPASLSPLPEFGGVGPGVGSGSRPRYSGVILLGVAIALQFFTGHTQTVFMSLVALGIYALLTRPVRGLIVLAVSGLLALLISLPQLLPTLQLMELSNRRGGFNLNQATAFSFSPFIFGRGLLPSYDGLIFSEYIAYSGVIGFALALFGIKKNSTTENTEKKSKFLSSVLSVFSVVNPFFVLAVVGVFLALGAFNPLYWLLAGLPGFNLFRVPARWLALFALGSALLAARGLQRLLDGERPSRRLLLATLILIGGLALSTALTGRLDDGTPAPPPTLISVVGWIIAGVAFVALSLTPNQPHSPSPSPKGEGVKTAVHIPPLRSERGLGGEANSGRDESRPYIADPLPLSSFRRGGWGVRWLLFALLLELFLAGRVLPAQNLVPPEAFEQQRFTVSQLLALNEGQNPPGRVLSISDGLFDPGDRAALAARWFDLSPEALQTAFVTVKQRELLAPNLPLLYGIPSVDGFDGGLLPTSYYTAFTSLMIPDGELRTIDGRLREVLASEACRGACIPDQRWLSLTNTRWLVLDKVYDLVHDGIFYDTGIPQEIGGDAGANYRVVNNFETTEVHLVYHCWLIQECSAPAVQLITDADGSTEYLFANTPSVNLDNGYQLARIELETPSYFDLIMPVAEDIVVDAVTLVDTRTGDFQQLTPTGWRRVLSSDVKIYQNLSVYPRAFMLYSTRWTPDTSEGTETALALMRQPRFYPRQEAIIAGNSANLSDADAANSVTITDYTPDRVVIAVETEADGYLLLTDAYYPGWRATIDGEPTTIYRADIMFRAVFVPAGTHEIVYTYDPFAQ